MLDSSQQKIAAVIPCFGCRKQILRVLKECPPFIDQIYVVDDACPEQTGNFVKAELVDTKKDTRVAVIFHSENKGVGGAMITGYKQALQDGATIVLKIDGDGQMDPQLSSYFIKPILAGEADYTKGNRFFAPQHLLQMPWVRLIGNSILSFVSKVATGYWQLMDPNNGYTAIHRRALSLIDLDRLESRYFFETDMLFRLNTIRAVVQDIPMRPLYADETSHLSIRRTLLEFPIKYLRCLIKRVCYTYLIRDFNMGTIHALGGTILFVFGTLFGLYHWKVSIATGVPATSGTVMISAMPLILGFQLLLSALSFDVSNLPNKPLQNFNNDDRKQP